MTTVGIVTTARSDFGVYVPVLKAIKARGLALRLYVTGSHLLGPVYSVRDIRKGGFAVSAQVKPLPGDTPRDVALNMGRITSGFAAIFQKSRPDILLVLGDRYDMHAAALAAIPFNIPLAHIHGGELTQGAFDEYFRHSLTKLSHVHFASTKVYARRIVQMGEDPSRVFVSGAPGLDNAVQMDLLDKKQLAAQFGVDFSRPVVLATFHPVTLEYTKTPEYVRNFLNAVAALKECSIVFTAPNFDTGSSGISRALDAFVRRHANSRMVENFGTRAYLSMMRHCVLMAGNSSSGILEAASFCLPVVNIGTRQDGRVRARNVIDTGYASSDILKGMRRAMSPEFKAGLRGLKNPYGDGKAGDRIAAVLAGINPMRLKAKKFHDL